MLEQMEKLKVQTSRQRQDIQVSLFKGILSPAGRAGYRGQAIYRDTITSSNGQDIQARLLKRTLSLAGMAGYPGHAI
jgi:hypothetical protein